MKGFISIMITSLLWKAGLLAMNSSYFPRLVEVAAWAEDREYSDDMVRKVAADPAILNSIQLTADESPSIDTVLAHLAVEHGEAMDTLIRTAVRNYTPPTGV